MKNAQLSRSCNRKKKELKARNSTFNKAQLIGSGITSVPKSTYIASMEGIVFTPAAVRIYVNEA
jgi:hypothetical protein